MELPKVNAVGLLEQPESYTPTPRSYPKWQKWAVFTFLAVFVLVTLITTVVSLGHYCLTTDGGDIRALPWGAPASSSPVEGGT
ncbi:MAG: hypothetical protein K0U98_14365 [Deltaproteobacteria bacterium]|nr:hypothetical protein [Deltaproteobacteria bacterium]